MRIHLAHSAKAVPGRLRLHRQRFAWKTPETATTQWRQVADQLRPQAPKLAALMNDAEPDVLAYMSVPKEHRTELHSISPLKRLSGEIKLRSDASPTRTPSSASSAPSSCSKATHGPFSARGT